MLRFSGFLIVLYCLNTRQLICFLGPNHKWLSGNESTCNAGDVGDFSLIPGSGRSFGEVNGNPLQYSCLENPIDSGAWQAIVHGRLLSSYKELDMN